MTFRWTRLWARLALLALLTALTATMTLGCACSTDESSSGGDSNPEPSNDDGDDDDDDDDDVKADAKVNAKKIYNKKCAGCHGKKGNKSPDFTDSDYDTKKKKIEKVIRKGKGDAMPAYNKKLDDDEIKALVKYVQAFKKADRKIKNKDKNKKSTKVNAKKIWAKKCAGCHGEKGNKSPDFTDSDYDTKKKKIEKVIRKGKGDAMPAYDDKLSDDEIKALVKYVRKLNN